MRPLLLSLLVLGWAGAADNAAVEDFAATVADGDIYKGTYNWLDMPEGNYGDKTLTLRAAETEAGLATYFQATFFSGELSEQFKEPKTYTYFGVLSRDADSGHYTGTVSTADKKGVWAVEMKVADDRFIGFAKQSTGHKTWGTFTVAKLIETAPDKAAAE